MAKKKRRKTNVAIIVVWIVIFLMVGGFFFVNYYIKKLQKESFDSMYPLVQLELCDEITLESGDVLTYDDNSQRALQMVPDQIKGCILSYNKDARIFAPEFDSILTGRKEVILETSLTDKYNQVRTSYQPMYVNVVDSYEPNIELRSEYIVCDKDSFRAIDNNVISVTDPKFGEYKHSDNGGNHTWKLDKSEVKYTVKGVYPVRVLVNDNGIIRERSFDVEIIPVTQ